MMESYKSSWETYTTMVKFATFVDKDEEGFVRALLRLSQGKGNDERAKSCMLVQILEKMITSFFSIVIALDTFLADVVKIAGMVPTVTGLYPFDETYTCKVGQKIVLTTGKVKMMMMQIHVVISLWQCMYCNAPFLFNLFCISKKLHSMLKGC